jgi:hypothetical protein
VIDDGLLIGSEIGPGGENGRQQAGQRKTERTARFAG